MTIHHNTELDIYNIYIRPNAPIVEIMTIMSNIVTHPLTHKLFFIVGDFNLNMCKENIMSNRLMKHMQQYNTNFVLNKIHTINRPLTDPVWTNSTSSICSTSKSKAYWIDHLATTISIHCIT